MKKLIVAAALGATLLAGSSAFAGQEGAGKMDRALRADTNKDGVVTREEMLAAIDKRFARMDKNGDGQISKDEAQALGKGKFRGRMGKRWAMRHGAADAPPPPPPGAEGAPDMPPPPPEGFAGRPGRGMHRGMGGHDMGERMLARLDTNRDGLVSLAEEQALATQRFDMVDANHDGKIDKAERKAVKEKIRELRAALGPIEGRGPGHPGMMPPPPAAAPQSPTGE